MPDFSKKLDKLEQLEEFRDLTQDGDINRVLLFSKKGNIPPIFKILSAIFRDRFRFGFVNVDTAKDIVKQFEE